MFVGQISMVLFTWNAAAVKQMEQAVTSTLQTWNIDEAKCILQHLIADSARIVSKKYV